MRSLLPVQYQNVAPSLPREPSILLWNAKQQMTGNTVLIVTASYDEAPRYVGAALEKFGVPFFRLDTDRFPSEVQASFDPHEGVTIFDRQQSISSREVKSVWYRRNVASILPENLNSGVREFCQRENRAFLEGMLTALPTQRWLSCPRAIWQAEHKLYQLRVAAQLGFSLPHTVVANAERTVRASASGRSLVAKAVASGYIAEEGGNRAIFTSALSTDDLEDLSGLALAPVTFQERVEKASDIRVTVIGDEVFAAEILSQSRESSRVDWRATDNENLEHRTHELPIEIEHLCLRLTSHLGLNFGAIDLALKPDGTYVFFEINPNGEWLWLEDILGLPISDRIAAWLTA